MSKSLSREDAAQLLGMKVAEIRNVEVRGGETLVTTHDGVVTSVDGDKLTTRQGDGDVVVAQATEDGPEVVSAGGPDGQASVVAQAMALPVDDGRADVRVVDEALFGAALDEDLAELGLARRSSSVRADAPPALADDIVGEKGPELVDVPAFKQDGGLAKALAGTRNDVAQWVGNDPDKARRAIEAEKARTDQAPRVTLIAELEKKLSTEPRR